MWIYIYIHMYTSLYRGYMCMYVYICIQPYTSYTKIMISLPKSHAVLSGKPNFCSTRSSPSTCDMFRSFSQNHHSQVTDLTISDMLRLWSHSLTTLDSFVYPIYSRSSAAELTESQHIRCAFSNSRDFNSHLAAQETIHPGMSQFREWFIPANNEKYRSSVFERGQFCVCGIKNQIWSYESYMWSTLWKNAIIRIRQQPHTS